MRRLGSLLSIALLVGCNAILENEPGLLDARASASGGDAGPSSSSSESEPTEPISGGADGDDAGSKANGTDEGDASDEPTGCTMGSKACGDLCVSSQDPFFGCADPACARCNVANATAACGPTGACAIGACTPGFADCNASAADGCETSLQTVNDCGACGLKCPVLKNVVMACVGGACSGTCAAGFGDCNGKAEDGCEKNLLTDKRNCGACGTRCAIGRCEQGVCVWP